jgi:hypothetical protein
MGGETYVYFISYFYTEESGNISGMGNFELRRTTPITGYEDVKAIQGGVEEREGSITAIILNFQLLRTEGGIVKAGIVQAGIVK